MALSLAACGAGTGRRDEGVEELPVGTDDSGGSDGTVGNDGMSNPDGVGPNPDGGDGGGPTADGGDASPGDGGRDGGDATAPGDSGVPVGECTAEGPVAEIFREGAANSRELYVAPLGASGYAVGASWEREIITQTQLAVLSAAGAVTSNVAVSDFSRGIVQGGALYADGDGLVYAMSSNQMGGLDIYAQRANAMGMPRGEPARLVTDTDISERPKIVKVGSNYIVAWRSLNEMTRAVRLLVAGLDSSFAPMMSMSVAMEGSMSNEFDLAAGTSRAVLVYVSAGTLHTLVFGDNAQVQGTEVVVPPVTGGGGISANVGVAMNGDAAAIFWTESIAGTWLHGVRFDAAARRVDTRGQVDYPAAGMGLMNGVSSVGATVDQDNGYAVFFRGTTGGSGAIGMMRMLGTTLEPRVNRVSWLARSPGGAQVRAASRGDRSFGVAWVDADGAMAVGRAIVARCP